MCYVKYNLPHISLKVTMTFEWSCGCASVLEQFFPSLVCVYFLKKKKTSLVGNVLCKLWKGSRKSNSHIHMIILALNISFLRLSLVPTH